jgi:YidC/Oxa1 family membrane protein insertase
MEQRNLFAAIFLTILVYVVWFNIFPPKNPPSEQTVKEKTVNGSTQESQKDSSAPSAYDAQKELPTIQASDEEKFISVETPLYKAEFSNRGGVVKQLHLKNYKETNLPDSELKYLIDKSIPDGTYGLSFKNKTIKGIEGAFYATENTSPSIQVKDEKKILRFVWKSENGVIVEKIFEFLPDSYRIGMKVVVKNGSDQTIKDSAVVELDNKVSLKRSVGFVGPSLYLNKEMVQVDPGKVEKENHFKGEIHWLAIQDRYFIMSLISNDKSESEVDLSYDKQSESLRTSMSKDMGDIASGTQKEIGFGIYAGPKIASALKDIGSDMEKIIDYGMFDIIAKPCLTLMNMIYNNVVKNYGIAIILLTILFKIILWPLGTKSYRSMNDMKKLQPLVNEIRQKHASNKQKMNEEMMNLYKTYKVNPLSGCLPLIVQMPIFFAFYRMLYSSIELRHAPFFGWITDLSAPDRLFHFSFVIPYFDPPTGIPVLTLLMGGSMFLQQKMSPPAGDPAQAKMMMFMPVFMTFIFLNFSSGLVLYWLVNNIVSIIQQYYIMKKYA